MSRPRPKGTRRASSPSFPSSWNGAGTTSDQGSITGIYTVLVEGDDLTEPVADAVRSIADGHVVLSRDLANQGHYPSIDVLGSISRVMGDVTDREQMAARARFVSLLAAYRKAEDLINIGAYVAGSNAPDRRSHPQDARDQRLPPPGGRRAGDLCGRGEAAQGARQMKLQMQMKIEKCKM